MVFASIIIPAYNEEKYIYDCLSSLQKQSFKDIEIIIVDDGSTDKTKDIAKSFPKVRLIKGKHRGPGFSRNLGAKKSKGKVLVFVDADMSFHKDYLKNLLKPLIKDSELIGSTHDKEVAINLDNTWARLWGKDKVNWAKEDRQSEDMIIFRAIRKDKFLDLGGFDPIYGYADDQTFFIKYKLLPFIARDAICYHKNPETLDEVYKQSKWIGASLNNIFIKSFPLKYFTPIILAIISPLIILILSIKKSYNNKAFKFFFPWMLIFMTCRYLGTINGMLRKIYLNRNIK